VGFPRVNWTKKLGFLKFFDQLRAVTIISEFRVHNNFHELAHRLADLLTAGLRSIGGKKHPGLDDFKRFLADAEAEIMVPGHDGEKIEAEESSGSIFWMSGAYMEAVEKAIEKMDSWEKYEGTSRGCNRRDSDSQKTSGTEITVWNVARAAIIFLFIVLSVASFVFLFLLPAFIGKRGGADLA